MNSRSNNTLLQTGYRQLHVSFIPLRHGARFGLMGPMDPFGSELYVPAFASPRIASESSTLNLGTSDNYTMPRNLQSSNPLPVENQQAVLTGLEKLRREIYNPAGSRPRISLYYRDHNNSRSVKSHDNNNEDGKRCVVCLDDFEPREMVTVTPCNHMFHDKCIVPWVKSHGQCPVCRFVISDGRNKEKELGNGRELGSDPFAEDLISFIRRMESHRG